MPARVHSLVNQEAAASEENPLSQGFDVVALTASADGLNALSCVLSALPANFPAAIVVVQHLSPRHPSLMAQILNRCTPLVVKEAKEGSQLSPGQVFIAPPDRRREGERGRGGEGENYKATLSPSHNGYKKRALVWQLAVLIGYCHSIQLVLP
ncbi:MAG TPA: chemotaxis protein CheB [Oculatellaceae cyanobacterium]